MCGSAVMAASLLTDNRIRSLKSSRPVEHFDSKVTGLSLRVSPSGRKTFYLSYRFRKRKVRTEFGRYGVIGLTEARDRAAAIWQMVQEGKDPRKGKIKFGELVDEFIAGYARQKNRDWEDTERRLKQYFGNRWE